MPSFNCALLSGLPMFDICGECNHAASYRTENIIHIIISQPQIRYKWTRFSKKSPRETSNSLNMDKENAKFRPSNSLFLDKHRWELPGASENTPRSSPNGMAASTLSVEHLKVCHAAQFLHAFEKESGDEMGSVDGLTASNLQVR